jgi:DmsE family decaheme c-type cytochrome
MSHATVSFAATRHIRTMMRKFLPWLFGLAFLFFLGSAMAQEAPPATAAHPGAFDVADCQGCHDEAVFTNFQHSQHAKKVPGSCAQCHGDVATHAKMMSEGEGRGPIVSFKTLTPRQINETCLGCHDRRAQANWHGGAHDRRGLSCVSCHSVHFFKSQRSQLRTASETETCYSCHKQVRSQTMRQSHHPIREGKMGCASCHDPHSGNKALIKAESVNDLCYTCHSDKRGPFMWEHAPVRESCVNCHAPHGSNHERLLVAKQPWLCQRCHLNTRHPGTLYDRRNSTAASANPTNRAIEHGCRNCHQQVHGTNAPSGPYLGR